MNELTRPQKQIQKAAREFARGEFDKTLALELDKTLQPPQKILAAAANLGFIGIHFEEAFQGGGLGILENTLVAEALCRKDSTLGSAIMLSALGSEALMRFGSQDLKHRFLSPVAQGKILSAMAFKEPGDPNPLSANLTKARMQGDHWVITGKKSWVINGPRAGFYCLLCQTDPDESPGKGLSLILVEPDREGVRAIPADETMGLRATGFAHLDLDRVQVPVTHLLGEQGKGLEHAQACMDETRILLASLALGIAQGALDRALDHVRQRVQFGVFLARFQVTQHKLARMATQIHLARLITYQAAWEFGKKNQDPKSASMARLVSTRTAVEVTDEAIQLLGGYGYMKEYEVERFFRDAKMLELLLEPKAGLKDGIAALLMGRTKKN